MTRRTISNLVSLLLVLLLALPLWAEPTGTHSGWVVRGESRVPVAGAIVLMGSAWTGWTNSAGQFRTTPLPVGTYRRIIRAPGFDPDDRMVQVLADTDARVGARLWAPP